MQEAYEITREKARRSADRGKRNYDNKVRSCVVQEGDHILVRNMTPRGGTGKLCSHWEDCIYKVVRQVNRDLPIYEVVPEQGKGRDSRILPRNLLLPCNHLPVKIPLKVAKPSTRKNISRGEDENYVAPSENSNDNEDDWYYNSLVQPPPAIQSQADENKNPTEMEYVNEGVNSESSEETAPQRDKDQNEPHLLE